MDVDPGNRHLFSTRHGELFFPWADLIFVGALWAFNVPTQQRQQLQHLVRGHNIASLTFLVLGLPVGISIGHP